MRIVHTCLRYPPAIGGTETYVHEIVERTRSVPPYDVRVLTSRLRTHAPAHTLDPATLLDDPPYVQRLHHAATPLIAYPRLQALSYYLGHHAPDIIHGYSFWYQPADVAARYAKKHSKPFIFHPLYYENEVRQKLTWQIYKKTIGTATFQAADVVVVISPYEQELITKAGSPVKRFALIPPGLTTTLSTTPPSNPFTKRGLAGPILLAVSRLAPGKGLEDLLDALPTILRMHPTAHLVLVGEDFGQQKELEKHVKKRNVQPHVHFWGKLSAADLLAAYHHATVFVHPSQYEAFGIVVAESLAAKVPVVARNVAAIPYVAPPNKAGLLFNTTEELSAHVIALLSDEKKRLSLGEWGHQYVTKNFSWDSSIKKITDLYKELNNS